VGHKAKFNKDNTMNEYNSTNNSNKNSNRGSIPREIVIIFRTEIQGGLNAKENDKKLKLSL
jgi:hypothetical protein